MLSRRLLSFNIYKYSYNFLYYNTKSINNTNNNNDTNNHANININSTNNINTKSINNTNSTLNNNPTNNNNTNNSNNTHTNHNNITKQIISSIVSKDNNEFKKIISYTDNNYNYKNMINELITKEESKRKNLTFFFENILNSISLSNFEILYKHYLTITIQPLKLSKKIMNQILKKSIKESNSFLCYEILLHCFYLDYSINNQYINNIIQVLAKYNKQLLPKILSKLDNSFQLNLSTLIYIGNDIHYINDISIISYLEKYSINSSKSENKIVKTYILSIKYQELFNIYLLLDKMKLIEQILYIIPIIDKFNIHMKLIKDLKKMKISSYHLIFNNYFDNVKLDTSNEIYFKNLVYFIDELYKYSIYPSISSFSSIIHVLYKDEEYEKLFNMLIRMRKAGFYVKIMTFSAVLQGLCKNNKITIIPRILDIMQKENLILASNTCISLLHLYCKLENNIMFSKIIYIIEKQNITIPLAQYHSLLRNSKSIKLIHNIILHMQNIKLNPNTETYNILIKYYCDRNMKSEALILLQKMKYENIKPNGVTYFLQISHLSE